LNHYSSPVFVGFVCLFVCFLIVSHKLFPQAGFEL
jgi:hypothetical protein